MKKHKITYVSPGSIANEMDITQGDCLLSINGQEVKDMLDYRWLMSDEHLLVEIEKPDGEIWELEIEADSEDDFGLTFAPGSMGEDRRCVNNCIFCFVDQQPAGLRESLYVKDDDPYQSFAAGNYITLSNLNNDDIQQIIKHRLSPLRVSVHAADMELRQRMMGNPKAAELFDALKQFSRAGLEMHFQVVLCKGINDGPALDYTIESLLALGDCAKSLAVVPVGLTRHRNGLYPLDAFAKDDALTVITQVGKWQARCQEQTGSRFVFLADEWYVLAGKPLPGLDEYEDFPQLDNGVGMMTLFEDDFHHALKQAYQCAPMDVHGLQRPGNTTVKCEIGIITGRAAGEFMTKLSRRIMESFPAIAVNIHVISNDFYGPGVTVSGLITGQDIISQLTGRCSGLDVLFIPENAFRAGTEDMICGATLSSVSSALGVMAEIGAADGGEFCCQILSFCDNHLKH
ncbi:MAG: DUF512 domain-containing protein [Defluviitaleaceae bacterium]|nr:DUF512 domain-containing protein [Defluviitaleaceae bacterium]